MGLEHIDTVFAFAVVMLLLSLVITMAVQFIVAVSGLRGRNLLWGITRLMERSPALKEDAKQIAKEAMEHPAVVSPTGRPATAIGSDELLVILKDLSERGGNLNQEVRNLLKQQLDELVPMESRKHAEELLKEVRNRYPQEAATVEEAFHAVERKVSKLSREFTIWFDAIMNRTTDRFIFYTRIMSVGFALLLALGLQIDSLDLLKNLSTDSDLRSKLIQSADATLMRAQATLLRKPVPVEVLEELKGELPALEGKEIPQHLKTRDDGARWLQNAVGPDPGRTQAVKRYQDLFDEFSRRRLQTLGKEVEDLRSELEKSKLVVLPADWAEYKSRWKNFFEHALGITISVLLLSLGAPFWFNTLRTVATLRPILAGQTDPSKRTSKSK